MVLGGRVKTYICIGINNSIPVSPIFHGWESGVVEDYCAKHPEKHVKVVRKNRWYYNVYPSGEEIPF